MRKFYFILICQTLLLSLAFAEDTQKPADLKKPETVQEACGQAFYYPMDFNQPCPKNVNITASFLYMDIYEEGLSFAIQVNEGSKSKSNVDYEPGLRLDIGFDRDKFSMNFVWTYINISSKDSISGANILGTFLPPNAGALDTASAKLSGSFHTFDWNFSKPYFVSCKFISTPSIGIRGAIIDQKYNLDYTIIGDIGRVSNKNDFWGIGLKAAYDATFILGKGFSLYGNIASSLLYSEFKISQTAQTIIATANYAMKQKFDHITPNSEISLGFTYCFVERGNFNGTFLLGYEFHQWWGMNRLRRFFESDPTTATEVSRNDLTFHGLIASLGFEF